jgi:hypothetical protein
MGRIWIETIRDVQPGEELAYDYAFSPSRAAHAGCQAALPLPLRVSQLPWNDPGQEALTTHEIGRTL